MGKRNKMRKFDLLFLLLIIVISLLITYFQMFSVPSTYKQLHLHSCKCLQPQLINTPQRYFNSVVESQPDYKLTEFKESQDKSGVAFWQSIKPGYACPSNLLTRVGSETITISGKWTCGLQKLGMLSPNVQPPCVVYSFGVGNSTVFEQEVLSSTHCFVYSHDHTVNKIGYPLRTSNPRVNFKKLGIGSQDTKHLRTLKTIMKQTGHDWLDILKMDVEEAEFEVLNKILEDFPDALPFGQLLMEVHVFNGWVPASQKTTRLIEFLQKLESRGLRMFKYEMNPHSDYNKCCSEMSFININTVVQPPWM